MEQPYLYAMSENDLSAILQIVESEKGIPRLNRNFGSPNHVLVEQLGKMVWLWDYDNPRNKEVVRKFFIDNYVEICSLPPLTQEQTEELGESAQILSRVIEKINIWALPAIANNDYDMMEALLAELFIDAAGCRFAHFSNNIHQLRRVSHIPFQGKHVSTHDIVHSNHGMKMLKIIGNPLTNTGAGVSVTDELKKLELRASVENAIVEIILSDNMEAMCELKSLLTGYSSTRH